MAVRSVMFAFLTALIAVNFIFAEENAVEPGDYAYDQPDGPNDGPNEIPPKKDDDDDGHEEKQERTFFALFNSYISCNSTMGSSYCLGCTQAVRCYPGNLGVVRSCRGLLRYCNGGRCSFFPGSECSSG